MAFVANLILFVTVQKLWKLVHIWQSYHRLCNVLFFMNHGFLAGNSLAEGNPASM